MRENDESKSKSDGFVPKSDAMNQMSEEEKKAMELAEEAEHEDGTDRTELQEEARKKAE